MEAIDQYLLRLSEPGVRDRLRQIYHCDEDVSREVVSEEVVKAAEKELGHRLPPSYRKLVTTVSPYDGGYEAYGLVDSDGFGGDLILVNQEEVSKSWPSFLIGIVPCLNGDTFCFDTRYPDKRGEYPIVLFNHEVHDEKSEDWTEFETVANDLGEFLLNSLEGGARREVRRSTPGIWELPASTVIRKGRSLTRRWIKGFSRRVTASFQALKSRLASQATPTRKPADREWLWQKMSPLLAAVDADNLQRAAELLEEGADPDAVSHSSTPLIWALKENHREMTLLLLHHGADPRVLGGSHESSFEIAFNRDPTLGAWFLQQVANPSVLDAAEAGTLDDVRRLVDAGGDVNMVSDDRRRRSPLHAALNRNHREMVVFLLERGAELVSRGSGYPYLFVAATQVYSSQLTELLLKHGADPNATDDDGRTPLFGVSESYHIEVLESLIRAGADVNFRDPNGETPLHSAARSTDPESRAIRQLIVHGADPNAQDDSGFTPLHVALSRTHADAAMTLLDLGADPTIRNQKGQTPVELVGEGLQQYPGIPDVIRRIGSTS